MNIFAAFKCPIDSARYLDDKRLVKMILESVQLLSTALNEHGGVGPYKTTHKNHPCAIWARETSDNWVWLYRHAAELANEYTKRYGRQHKSASYLPAMLQHAVDTIPDGALTPFANCARHKGLGIEGVGRDVHECYRDYLNQRWLADKRPAVATFRSKL